MFNLDNIISALVEDPLVGNNQSNSARQLLMESLFTELIQELLMQIHQILDQKAQDLMF